MHKALSFLHNLTFQNITFQKYPDFFGIIDLGIKKKIELSIQKKNIVL